MEDYPELEFASGDAIQNVEVELRSDMELPDSPSSDELDKLDGIDKVFRSPNKRRSSSPSEVRSGPANVESFTPAPSGVPREPEVSRARADEMSSSSPTIPRIPSLYRDTLGTYTELLNWFDTCPHRAEFLLDLPQEHEFDPNEPLDFGELDNESRESALRKLLYYLLGSYADVESLADHASRIEDRVSRFTQGRDLNSIARLPSENFLELTVLFVCLVMSPRLSLTPDFVSQLVKQIAGMRWKLFGDTSHSSSGTNINGSGGSIPSSGSPSSYHLLSQLIMILRVALIRCLGGSSELSDALAQRQQLPGPAEQEHKGDQAITAAKPPGLTSQAVYPLEYASFINTISARFPVSHFESDLEPSYLHDRGRSVFGLHGDGSSIITSSVATPSKGAGRPSGNGPADIAQSEKFIPYMPTSIKEACDLYKSRVLITPELEQYWTEQELVMNPASSGMETSNSKDKPVLPCFAKVHALYRQILPVSKSFVRVIVDYIIRRVPEAPNGGLHSAVTLLRLLLDWFKVSHVLKKDFLAALLFDAQFYLVAHRYCAVHSAVLETLLMSDSPGGFWEVTKEASLRGRGVSIADYGLPLPRGLKVVNPSPSRQVVVEDFSQMNLEIYVNFLAVSRIIVQGQPQRLIVVSELSPNPFKSLLHIYNKELWNEVLQLFKTQVAYNGKRWRFLNMEIISAIYLHCESRLDDDWLTGVDVAAEAKVAREKEAMLRKLTEYYNGRVRQLATDS